MAAILTELIPRQNFELVGEEIGLILFEELTNQKALQPSYLPEDFTVFHEKITPIDKTNEVVVNVLLDSTTPEHETASNTQNETNYFIDIYTHAVADVTASGDIHSSKKLLKFLGLCRYILDSPKYVTLNFPAGTIGGTSVRQIQVLDPQDNQDSDFLRMARINYSVRILENQQAWQGVLLDNNTTQAKLNETEKGYQYKINT